MRVSNPVTPLAPWGSSESRLVHTQENAGSNPAGATKPQQTAHKTSLGYRTSRHATRSVGKFGIPPGSYPGGRWFKSSRSHEAPADLSQEVAGVQNFPSRDSLRNNSSGHDGTTLHLEG